MSAFSNTFFAPVVLLVAVACRGGGDSVDPHAKSPLLSPSMAEAAAVSTTSQLLARSTFSDPNDQNFDIHRITDDWHIQIKSKPAFDIAVQSINFPPGSASGWHTHPGPVFIQVVSGTMTFYQSDDPTCSPQVRTAGQGFLDLGEHPHIAVNETNAPAQNIVTYFAPPGAALKMMATEPPNCTF
jgi:cupin domain